MRSPLDAEYRPTNSRTGQPISCTRSPLSVNPSPGRVVVVGAGVFGAAGALELRLRGWEVTLLERGAAPHADASSTDVSKLVRMEYGGDLLYHELAELALEGWDRWNAEWPRPLYHEHGLLLLAAGAGSPGGFERDSVRVLRERGYQLERIGGSELAARFPAWRGDAFAEAFWNPRAGWAESAAVVERLLELSVAAGVTFREARVRDLRSVGSAIAGVLLDDGQRLDAERVVLAAGAWTPALLPWLSGVMKPVAQPVLHFRVTNASDWSAPRFPPWAADISNTGWYGFPALTDGRVKVGHHGPGLVAPPEERGVVSADHEARCRAFLREAIPGLADAPLAGSRVCMYCDTIDGDFLIDMDPERYGLIVASGGSGHAFKFAPVLGSLIADAVEGKESRWSERFRWRPATERHREEARFDG